VQFVDRLNLCRHGLYRCMMLRTFPFLLLLVAIRAPAQCCCSDIEVQVTLDTLAGVGSEREFNVAHSDQFHWIVQADQDSTDRRLSIRLDAGCGVAERRVTITRRSTGECMELIVLFIGFDGGHPVLRVPFRSGTHEVDYERLIDCTGANEYVNSAIRDTLTSWSTVVACGPCQVLMKVDSNGVVLEPLPQLSGGCAAGRVGSIDPNEAGFPGGQPALQQEVERLYRLRRPTFQGFPNTLTGIGVVSDQGSFSTRIRQQQIDLVYNAERALEDLTSWRPASVLHSAAPNDRRPIRSIVRFTLDPSVP